jgi:hypothetical protein
MSTLQHSTRRPTGPALVAAACAAALLLLPLASQAAAPARSNSSNNGDQHYSWVDKNGERHYGDAVPPEYAQTERRVLNNQGVEVGHVDGVKTAQQVAEEKRIAAEIAAKAQHDRFLLTTYTTSKDIERLRDERLDQINGQIKAANAYIETLNSRLGTLTERSLHFKPYNTKPDARKLPDDLAEELVRTTNEVRNQKRSLDNRTREQDAVRAQFEADINRFRELTANQRG